MFKGAFQAIRFREPVFFSKTVHDRTWQTFLSSGTRHSANASMLCEILNRCEREGIPYILQASPGYGYYIKRGPNLPDVDKG
jgi:hypothetical protein